MGSPDARSGAARRLARALVTALVLGLGLVPACAGDVCVAPGGAEEATILPGAGGAPEGFHGPVALAADGTRALVRAIPASGAGALATVHVLAREGATFGIEATLAPADRRAGEWFGDAVALSADGTRALVGVLGPTSAPGRAFVFVRSGSTWSEEAMLVSSAPVVGDGFGASVALSADGAIALVGAPQQGIEPGAGHVFRRTGTSWVEEAVLTEGETADRLGVAVALSADGSRALLAASGDVARIYARTDGGWIEEAVLAVLDPPPGHSYAPQAALSGDGDRAFIGRMRRMPSDAGSVTVFARVGARWIEEATLVARDGEPRDQLGFSLAVSADGSLVLAGANADEVDGIPAAGSVHLFARCGTHWSEDATFVDADPAANDFFGGAVALSADGREGLVSVDADDTASGLDSGSVRVLRIGPR